MFRRQLTSSGSTATCSVSPFSCSDCLCVCSQGLGLPTEEVSLAEDARTQVRACMSVGGESLGDSALVGLFGYQGLAWHQFATASLPLPASLCLYCPVVFAKPVADI